MEDGVELLRELANEIEEQREIFRQAIELLKGLTASCPWELAIEGGSPVFWSDMRAAQLFLGNMKGKGISGV